MFEKQLEVALKVIKGAADIVMDVYNAHSAKITIKDDDSPVTQADLKSDEYIRKELLKYYPTYGMLTEETEDNLGRLSNEYVWIVDPIDGTKDFIDQTGEFAINIALSYKGEIVVGVIAIPAKNEYFYAIKNGGSFKEKDGIITKIHVSNATSNLIAYRSRFHRNDIEEKYYDERKDLIIERQICGSAYKSCKIAEGLGHIYLKYGKGTKEWDIAPCVIIVKEAGGSFTKPDGSEILFNKRDVYNHEGFLVVNIFNNNLLIK